MKKIIPLAVEGLNLTAIVDDDHLLLVDCGYPGFMERIERRLLEQGCTLKDLQYIVITHHDQDHVGGLREIADRFPDVEVISSAEQVPYIVGEKKSLRLQEMEEIYKTLPETKKAESLETQKLIESIKTIKKASAVEPGYVIPIYGGVEIVDTAGHQPGHISVYVQEEKILISGDALVLTEGRLRANPTYTLDMPRAVKSARKLLDYDIRKVICYHGGVFEGDVRQALQEMIQEQG
jgi:glyoxylase-like metal-dependent hydrolase (beta-lactamase superfamily II)